MSIEEQRAEFKRAELARWYDGECAGRVAEAVTAALDLLAEQVRDHWTWTITGHDEMKPTGEPDTFRDVLPQSAVLALIEQAKEKA